MPKRVVDLRTERTCLDIASFGRRGPEAKLTPSEVASIARTARRVPQVMIKVSGGLGHCTVSAPILTISGAEV